MKSSFFLLSSLVSIAFAQYDLPTNFDIGALYRPVTFSCFKKDPECVYQGLEHSECMRMGGTLTDCENLNAMYNCRSCHVEDAEKYRIVAFSAVKMWCAERGGTAGRFKENMNICTA